MRKSVGLKKKAIEEKGTDGKENDERGESNQEKEKK